jgi:glycosyltransferase involved in cell wall biosynthesis
MTPLLSVIIPIKNEAHNLCPLLDQHQQALERLQLNHELLFIDDGSTDGSWEVLQDLAVSDPAVKLIQLSRNFGQAAALQAGIDHAEGDIIVTLDGDLQNDAADIPLLVAKLDEGYDAIFGIRANRQDPWLTRRLPSQVANWLIRLVTGVPVYDMGCPVRALRRELAVRLGLYGGLHRFVPVLTAQLGARIAQVPVRHHPRVAGRSKYGLGRWLPVLSDLFTVQFRRKHCVKPQPRPYRVRATMNLGGSQLPILETLCQAQFPEGAPGQAQAPPRETERHDNPTLKGLHSVPGESVVQLIQG